jgi:putative intracellular protease/amidase
MKVYLYVLDTLADWEIGYITAELSSGRYFDKDHEKVHIVKIAKSKETIVTMGGMTIIPDEEIDEIEFNEGDLLILPGSDNWMNDTNQKIVDIVSKLLDKKVIIAAICGATLALAKNGLLNNRKHTSNDKGYLEMVCPNYKGSGLYINEPAVTDGYLITATGLAPLEFAHEILRAVKLMNEKTIDAWYALNKNKEPQYFYELMKSIR